MGRWMEVVRQQPPEGQRHHTEEYRRLIVGEYAPHPLLNAARAIRAGSRGEHKSSNLLLFPLLDRVQFGSPCYADEDLWLLPADAIQLLEEFTRLRRVCRLEEFAAGLDGRAVATWWRDGETPVEFERWLDGIEGLLRQAVEGGHWVRLML